MISLLNINVRGISNKHCLLPFFIGLSPEFPTDRISLWTLLAFLRNADVIS